MEGHSQGDGSTTPYEDGYRKKLAGAHSITSPSNTLGRPNTHAYLVKFQK